MPPERSALRVTEIDDWAWRKGHRYGTIVCDLERRQVIDLLPDREAATVEAWLAEHLGVEIVSRDRGSGYGQSVGRALPQAVQAADRWHLLDNASRAFVDAVRRSMRDIRRILGADKVSPDLLTAAERIQYQGFLHRKETNAAIQSLARDGVAIKEIVRCTGVSRQVVRRMPHVVSAMMSSARAKAPCSPGCPDWMLNGQAAAGTGPNCGGACDLPDFLVGCGL